jgi:hypothetical protein
MVVKSPFKVVIEREHKNIRSPDNTHVLVTLAAWVELVTSAVSALGTIPAAVSAAVTASSWRRSTLKPGSDCFGLAMSLSHIRHQGEQAVSAGLPFSRPHPRLGNHRAYLVGW